MSGGLKALFARFRKAETGTSGITLRRERPAAIDVPLGNGAAITVRPATSFEVSVASSRAAQFMTGLMLASDASATSATILGDEFVRADVHDPVWQAEIAKRFSLLELTLVCVDGWRNIRGPDGILIEEPSREALALLLQDVESANRIATVINQRYHQDTSEGNGLPVSPSGGAGTPDGAPDAAAPTSPVPSVGESAPPAAMPPPV
jgi:hypothetical protein